MTEKRKAVFDVFKVLISNSITLISGILIGFVVPEIMDVSNYGYYKTFSLYFGYVGILHFGISDGIFFYLSGKKKEEIDLPKLHSGLAFLFLIEAIISVAGLLISIFTIKGNIGLILGFVFIGNFFYQVQTALAYVCQATKDFSFPSIVSSAKGILDIASVLILLFLTKSDDSFSVSFSLYCIIYLSILSLTSLSFSIRLWKIIFSKGQKIDETMKDVLLYIKIGGPIMLANLTSSLIMTIDKQFVSLFYPIELSNTFSLFSFSYSVLTLITTATSAVSVVLFPYIKGKNQESLVNAFPILDSWLLIFVVLACSSVFIVEWFVGLYLPSYSDSIRYLKLLVPGLIVNSPITVLMHNYYKALKKEHAYFLQNIIILCAAILLDLAAYYLIVLNTDSKDPIWLTAASFLTIIIWYCISESYLVLHFKIKHLKNDLFILLACLLFFVVSYLLSGWAGFAVFLVLSVALCFLFYFKLIKNAFKEISNKRKTHL